MSEMLDAALRYARMGLSVIPLSGKRPIFDNWPLIATTDQEMVTRWWTQTPKANVGIATGQKSGCFVLDVDVKTGGQQSYDSLIHQHGRFPDTWQQITGTGGWHLFFRYPNFRVANAAALFTGIDIRGDGGQVVAPPSVHPETHTRYHWDGLKEIEETPLAECPPWLLEVLAHRTQPKPGGIELIAAKIGKGGRHKMLLSLAGMMRRLGLEPAEIIPTLRLVNSTRCDPPHTQEHVDQIAQSIGRYRPADKDLFVTAGKLWREAAAREHEKARAEAKVQLASVDGLTVYRSQAAEQKCLVDRLLFNGLTILAGRPKVGKSWLALQLVICISRGQHFLGNEILRPGGVGYFALEESQNRTATRMQKVLPTEDVMLQNIQVAYSVLPEAGGGLIQLEKFIDERKPNLVVVDTFLAFVGRTKERRDVLRGDYEEIQQLHELAQKHQVAIVLVHHLRKGLGNESGVDAVAGTTGITAAADAVWTMKREPDRTCTLDIVGRDTEEQSLVIRFDQQEPFGWQLVGDGAQIRESREEREIMELLKHEGAMSSAKASQLLRLNANRVRSVLYELNKRGLVNRQGAAYVLAPEAREGER